MSPVVFLVRAAAHGIRAEVGPGGIVLLPPERVAPAVAAYAARHAADLVALLSPATGRAADWPDEPLADPFDGDGAADLLEPCRALLEAAISGELPEGARVALGPGVATTRPGPCALAAARHLIAETRKEKPDPLQLACWMRTLCVLAHWHDRLLSEAPSPDEASPDAPSPDGP